MHFDLRLVSGGIFTNNTLFSLSFSLPVPLAGAFFLHPTSWPPLSVRLTGPLSRSVPLACPLSLSLRNVGPPSPCPTLCHTRWPSLYLSVYPTRQPNLSLKLAGPLTVTLTGQHVGQHVEQRQSDKASEEADRER